MEGMMLLPRIASSDPVPASSQQEPPAGQLPGGGRPTLSAEALANLRAAVLLRLLEAMMRQVDRGGDKGSAAAQLLEVLFAVMKALPDRDGKNNEASRRLASILSRLPAEVRPAIERLLTTALSATPTRVLMEIIRNPGGPEAQRLAQALVAAAARETPKADPMPKGPQRFATVEAQLAVLSKSVRQELLSDAGRGAAGDSRALQAALRRMFEGSTEKSLSRSSPPSQNAPAEARSQGTSKITDPGLLRDAGSARAFAPSLETANGRSAPPPNGLEADNDDGPPAGRTDAPVDTVDETVAAKDAARMQRDERSGMLRLIAGIVSNLSEDDTLVLRLLLAAPLPEQPATESLDPSLLPGFDGEEAAGEQPTAGNARSDPSREGAVPGRPAGDPSKGEIAGKAADGRAVPTAADDGSASGEAAADLPGEDAPVRNSVTVAALPDRPADRPLMLPTLRDGLPLAFVPYLPAQEDIETRDTKPDEERDEEEASNSAADDEAGGEGSDDGGEEPQAGEEEVDPDLTRRRSRMDELAGPPGPGSAFYQKLGDYWT